MKTQLGIGVAALLIVLQLVGAYTFNYSETDLVKLVVNASDADNESIFLLYAPPLNASGQWQTKFGDAGIYETTIAVIDNASVNTQVVSLVISKKKEAPIIIPFGSNDILSSENVPLLFEVQVIDPNNDELMYEWTLDGIVYSNTSQMSWTPDYASQGDHVVKLTLTDSDGLFDEHLWDVSIVNVDRFAAVNDTTVKEGQTVRLALPNIPGLQFSISDPLGDDNEWRTSFNDSGVYVVTFKAFDRLEEFEKQVTITVENVDRPLRFAIPKKLLVVEGDVLEYVLQASDPDGDSVFFSLKEDVPGLQIDGETLVYTSSFGNLTSLEFGIEAKAGESVVEKQVQIKIKNSNRAPTISAFSDISVNEGELYNLPVDVFDPDGDVLSYEFVGFENRQSGRASFNDAGKYGITVRVSDGDLYTQSHAFLTVSDVNRPPVIDDHEFVLAQGDMTNIELKATDPDGNDVVFSLVDGPAGAVIQNNRISWVVPDEFENVTSFTVKVSDGESFVEKTINAVVQPKNQPPKLMHITPVAGSIIGRGEKVLISVQAQDPEGKPLSYFWDLGAFKSYVGSATLPIKYDKVGKKSLSITVSDGLQELTVPYYLFVA